MRHFLALVLISLICFTGVSFGQVHVSGDLKKLGNSQVIIQYYEGEVSKTVTVKVKEGKFIWEAPVTEAQKVMMIFPGRATWIFVEPGRMTITGSRDSLETLRVTGSKTNDEALVYAQLLKPLAEEEKPLFPKYGKLEGAAELELEAKVADLIRRKYELACSHVASHRQSAFSLSLVSEYSRLGTFEEVNRMFELLSKKMKSTSEGKRIAERLLILKRSAIGEKMLAFTQNDDKGKPISLSDFKGKYVLIDFWASWCAPCRTEIPNIIRAYNEYKNYNFKVLSISLDDSDARWKEAIVDMKMPWAQVCDLKAWKGELPVYYGLKGIPSSLLIDPNGNIVARDLRGILLDKKLKELLVTKN
ncbi:AhpC/TSA family protein [Pedobacter sp. MC2016-14]|uniref:TlpA disulfide reductase family protein n=1 Tax=Pedobacter sp. MC2016-14 TaxID=2897327 RepID=UPI001E43745D|nr:TlpA disulfide reductase family protein [Pedobacter sp. MC2016-14]MCD0487809.1 AhpC/TSA family protein [Pedobacter sp. MC2016-14]